MLRSVLLTASAIILLLGAILVGRTLLVAGGDTALPAPTPAIAVDGGAAGRLAGALRYRTVSATLSDPATRLEFTGLHEYLKESFPRAHAGLERETVNGLSLLYRWQGSEVSLAPMLINAHFDVAPVEEATVERWTHPPFAGKVADGYVWGRGAIDMKHSLMALLEAAEYLLAEGFAPRRTIYFAFGHDEETGGGSGAAEITSLLAGRGVSLGFTLDEGSAVTHGIVPGLARPAALIGVAEKGYATLKITARAEGGHSSMPPRETAIGRLAGAIKRLEANPMPARLEPPASDMFDTLAPDMSFGFRLLLANRWLFDTLLLYRMESSPAANATVRTTMAPTMVTGGIKPNVLAKKAMAVINYRILPGDTIESVITHTRAAVDDPSLEIGPFDADGGLSNEPSRISDRNSDSFAMLAMTIRQIFPDAVVAPSLVIGGTDSKHYEAAAENSYRFLPLRLTNADLPLLHGTDERISIANYETMIRFYIQFLRNATS